jgi:hypothetical protein
MPTRNYEHTCGHVRSMEDKPYQIIYSNKSSEPSSNPHLSFQPCNSSLSYLSPPNLTPATRYPDTSAAAALEYLDRQSHARIAGPSNIRRPSMQLRTRTQAPYSTSTRRNSNRGKYAQLYPSPSENDSQRGRVYYKDYPCRACRASNRMERRRSEISRLRELEMQRSAKE